MQNNQQEQIDYLLKEVQSLKDKNNENEIKYSETFVDIKNITSTLQTVVEASGTTTLTQRTGAIPKNVYEQMFIYYTSTGPVTRLYIYDIVNKAWKYVALT